MKVYVFIIACFIALTSCHNQDASITKAGTDTANFTRIHWIDSVKNIGTVAAGHKAEITFRFKNTGEKPLFIISARPGCGCTVADYPKEAIAPGKEGTIKANYDVHKGAVGEFRKNINVTTNTKGSTSSFIFFYGTVKNDGDTAKTTKAVADTSKVQKL